MVEKTQWWWASAVSINLNGTRRTGSCLFIGVIGEPHGSFGIRFSTLVIGTPRKGLGNRLGVCALARASGKPREHRGDVFGVGLLARLSGELHGELFFDLIFDKHLPMKTILCVALEWHCIGSNVTMTFLS